MGIYKRGGNMKQQGMALIHIKACCRVKARIREVERTKQSKCGVHLKQRKRQDYQK